MSHTTRETEPEEDRCLCDLMTEIPFLGTLCKIKDGKIITDLHKKSTDRNQYLLPSSCHPTSTIKAIPYSLSLRIVRICNTNENRDKRLAELKIQLLERGYKERLINSAINRAIKVPRRIALRKVTKSKKTEGPIFTHTYDPRLPSISNIQAKHYRTMVSRDTYLGEVFKETPMTAYRRNPNLRNFLIRAKVPQNQDNRRQLKGMKKCGKGCTACPFIQENKSIKINNKEWKIKKKLNCNAFNVIYAIVCQKEKCKLTYIGETKRLLKTRLADHCGYVRNNRVDTATGKHFNSPGHTLGDLRIIAIEQSRKKNNLYRKQREEYHINRFNTLHKGMNRKK